MKYIIEDETLKAIVDRICTAIERVTESINKSDEISAKRSTNSEFLRNLPEVDNVMRTMKSKEDKDNEDEDNEDKTRTKINNTSNPKLT